MKIAYHLSVLEVLFVKIITLLCYTPCICIFILSFIILAYPPFIPQMMMPPSPIRKQLHKEFNNSLYPI